MPAVEKKLALKGSAKAGPQEFAFLSPLELTEVFSVTVRLRPNRSLPTWSGTRMSHRQHTLHYGARREDIATIKVFAKAHGLTVQRTHAGRREVVLRGTAAAMQNAFGVELRSKRFANQLRRVRAGEIQLPKSIAQLVTSVTGLDNRPFARPHFRIQPYAANVVTANNAARSFTPCEIAALYHFPEGLDGTGQSIAIPELGGGFRGTELTSYFQTLGLQAPAVSVVSFPGCGGNNPGLNALDPFCRDVEVMLDLQMAGGAAPGAKLFVYFAEDDSDQSFLSVFSAMVHDAVNKPNIISLSWGVPEKTTTQQFRDEFDQLLQSAAHLGITVCAATGDNAAPDFAADDPEWDKGAHVDFPASSPWALACGGSRIEAPSGTITSEQVWFEGPNDGSGGGISRFFDLPDFQTKLNLPRAVAPDAPPKRGIPDICANAAPASGYRILCNRQSFPDAPKGVAALGGTSAVAPLFAALVARLNQGLGKACGYLNPTLYSLASEPGQTVFRAITGGTNGAYTASAGSWNACGGLGSIDGTELLAALRKKSGTPL